MPEPGSVGARARCRASNQSETFEQSGNSRLFFLDGDHACFKVPDIDTQPAEQGDLERREGDPGSDDGPGFDAHVMTFAAGHSGTHRTG